MAPRQRLKMALLCDSRISLRTCCRKDKPRARRAAARPGGACIRSATRSKSVRQGGHRLCGWVLLWPLQRRSKPAIHGRSGLARLIPECPGVTPKRFRLTHQKRKPRRVTRADRVALGGPQKIAPQSKPGPRRAGKLAIALDAQKPHDDPRHTPPASIPVPHGTHADAEQIRARALAQ